MVETVGTKIEGEEEGSTLDATQQDSRNEERKTLARDKGWKPREEWIAAGKDPVQWVSAKEFLGRQSLFDKIESLKSAMFQKDKAHEKQLLEIRKYIGEMSDREYKKAVSDLKLQRRVAIKEGDSEVVEQIEEKIEQVQEERAKAKVVVDTPPTSSGEAHPAFQTWIQANPWYANDPELKADADAFGAAFANRNRELAASNPEKVLEYVAEKIKKANPDKFTTQRKSVSKVEGGGRNVNEESTVGGKKLEVFMGDLTPEQRKIAKTVINSGVLDARAQKNKITAEQQYLLDLQTRLQTV